MGETGTPVAGAHVGGDAPASRPIELRVVLAPRDEAALEAYAIAVSTPDSIHYREHLAPGEFGSRFGPTPAAIDAVRTELVAAGLVVGAPSPSGLVLPVHGTVAQAEVAFATRLVTQTLPSGAAGVLNTDTPTLSGRAAAAVAAVVGLTTSAPAVSSAHIDARGARRTRGAARTPAPTGGARPRQAATDYDATPCDDAEQYASDNAALTADVLANAYDFDPVYGDGLDGQGVTVAMVQLAAYAPADIAAYASCYGINPAITNVNVNGGPSGPPDVEPTLDIEVLAGLAPGAAIRVYQSPNSGADWVDLIARIADDDRASIVSSSWGLCEAAQGQARAAAQRVLLLQMAVQGQSYLNAAMDHGSSGCDPVSPSLAVSDLSSQVWATGVGGTRLLGTSFPPTETAWNLGGQGGGGGISTFSVMPDWQAGPGVVGLLSSGVPCGAPAGQLCREVPDVSAQSAQSGSYVIYLGGWVGAFGTSAATPLWAALIALADESPGCRDSRPGFLNPFLYSQAPGLLNDVTSGDNDALGLNGGLYPATAGYDMATGLGSPRGAEIVGALCPSSVPAITTETTTWFRAGTPGSFTVRASSRPFSALTASGTLPGGLSFTDRGDGTATLAGTPGDGTMGSFPLIVTASNGVGTPANQALTVSVIGADAPEPVPSPTAESPSSSSSGPSGAAPRRATGKDHATVGNAPVGGWPVSSRGRLVLPVECPAVLGGCTVDLRVVALVGTGQRRTKVALGRKRGASVGAAAERSVAIALNAAALRRLRAAGLRLVPVRITLKTRFSGGARSTAAQTVVLRLG